MGHCLKISSLYRNIDVVDMVVVVVRCHHHRYIGKGKIEHRSMLSSKAREIFYRIIRSDPQELEPIRAMIFSK